MILLNCISSYPASPEELNLKHINKLKKYSRIVGYSDHSVGLGAALYSIPMGAKVVEKHFTLNKKAKGPDHAISADPIDLEKMVQNIRLMEKMRGNGLKSPAYCELGNRKNVRKSVVALKNIKKGTKITRNLLEIKRPGFGIPPNRIEEIVGKKTRKMIKMDMPIKYTDLE